MRPRRRFDERELEAFRLMSVEDVLLHLGLYWKRDASFVPIKVLEETRLHVTLSNGRVVEILAKGPKFWIGGKGGGGAIDLVIALYGVSFVDAVKKLRAS